MSQDIIFSLIEIGISIVFESIILGLIFQQLSNRAVSDTKTALEEEMKKIEDQNKFDFQQLQQEIRLSKTEILSEIKEVLK
jgi:type II secretory pathway component PulJ